MAYLLGRGSKRTGPNSDPKKKIFYNTFFTNRIENNHIFYFMNKFRISFIEINPQNTKYSSNPHTFIVK